VSRVPAGAVWGSRYRVHFVKERVRCDASGMCTIAAWRCREMGRDGILAFFRSAKSLQEVLPMALVKFSPRRRAHKISCFARARRSGGDAKKRTLCAKCSVKKAVSAEPSALVPARCLSPEAGRKKEARPTKMVW